MTQEAKISSLEQRLKLFSVIAKLGHEAFAKTPFDNLSLHILNNSRSLIPYERSCLIDFRSGKPKIVGVTGESKVNPKSDFCQKTYELIKYFSDIETAETLDEDSLEKRQVPSETHALYKKHFQEFSIILLPLRHPDNIKGELFIWMVEFQNEFERIEDARTLFFLLANHYREALWYRLEQKGLRAKGFLRGSLNPRRIFRPLNIFRVLLLGFIIALFAVRVPQKAVANFEFVPKSKEVIYAPFTGTIDKVLAESGDEIARDQKVLRYETEEMFFDLAIAQKQKAEILAELDLNKTMAFKDVELRGKSKILQLKLEQELNKIKKYKWFLERSDIKAKRAGILVIEDKNILTGKRVMAGDKLFETLSREDIIAEVFLNEKDAVVLSDKLRITLYAHVMPELPINVKIISISPVPLPGSERQFVYRVKVEPANLPKDIYSGMRGIANIYGEQVSLGYYLFRSLIIWWRKL